MGNNNVEFKKTKIVTTISDKRCEVDFIRSLYESGMNCVRINSAHVTTESASRIVENTRAVANDIAIMIDTKGPEIRITGMTGEFDRYEVKTGDRVVFMGTDKDLQTTREVIYLNDENIYRDVPIGAKVLIDDGELELCVIEKLENEKQIVAEVKNDGFIKPRKSVNIPGIAIDLESVTEKDKEFILWAIEEKIDFIAHSFVRNKKDVMSVKNIIKKHNSDIKIISKIENRDGVDNIDEILEATYGIMVARGDLGVEIPAQNLPVIQRHIVKKCVAAKAPVIIATQMLHSMIENPRPTRAEVSDIAGAIYQRVDAVMLSGETANGLYPVEAVQTMASVALEIEKDHVINTPFLDLNLVRLNHEITAQLARSAVRASINLPIKAVIIDTQSGRTGRYLAAFRGHKPVYAVCYHEWVVRRLAISYGMTAMYQEPAKNHNGFLLNIFKYLTDHKDFTRKDMIVVLGGSFGASKGASFMEIGTVENLEEKALSEG